MLEQTNTQFNPFFTLFIHVFLVLERLPPLYTLQLLSYDWTISVCGRGFANSQLHRQLWLIYKISFLSFNKVSVTKTLWTVTARQTAGTVSLKRAHTHTHTHTHTPTDPCDRLVTCQGFKSLSPIACWDWLQLPVTLSRISGYRKWMVRWTEHKHSTRCYIQYTHTHTHTHTQIHTLLHHKIKRAWGISGLKMESG